MIMRKCKIFGCLLLIGAIVVSFGVALADASPGFGKTLTTAQMANMFGGGFVCSGDTDCDTTSGSCPGGDTCADSADISNCRDCKSGNGDICGAPGGAGWQCVNGTEDCNDGSLGSCSAASCEAYIGGADDGDSCGTRPDC
jgi:hypothetical protein